MGTIAIVKGGQREPALTTAAQALAELLGLATSEVAMPPGGRAARLRDLVDSTDRPTVRIVALSGADPLFAQAMAAVRKPLLVVPDAIQPREKMRRVLVPLDGDPQTSATVSDIVTRAASAGAWTGAVHVFDAQTTPAFWDQAAHTRPAWTDEFQRRHLPAGDGIDLRSGDPAEQLLDAAHKEDVDLIVIGWRHHLSRGHARVVRRLVQESPAPVLLLDAGTRGDAGP